MTSTVVELGATDRTCTDQPSTNYVIMSAQRDEEAFGSGSSLIWFVISRTATVLFLMLTGLVGNGMVIKIYRQDKKLSGAVYIIALAMIDLFWLVLLLPHLPLLELSDDLNSAALNLYLENGYGASAKLSYYTYLCVQVTMALDQFIAVFRPFKHKQIRKRLNGCMLAVAALIALVQCIRLVIPDVEELHAFSGTIVLVCMTVLTGVYSATALKLYTQGRAIRPRGSNVVAPKTISQRTTTVQAAEAERASTTWTKQPPPGKKRAMHIQALKIYTSIFLVFVGANAAATVVALRDVKWLSYIYCINHMANPVIYYCFVEKFRKRVKEYCGRLTR